MHLYVTVMYSYIYAHRDCRSRVMLAVFRETLILNTISILCFLLLDFLFKFGFYDGYPNQTTYEN